MFHKPIRNLAAGVLALALGLFAGASNSQATTFVWTNVTDGGSDYWQNQFAWNPSTNVPGGVADTATFNFSGTVSVYVTNNVINLAVLDVGPNASGGVLTITFELGTNVFTGISSDTSSASGFVIGQGGGGFAGTAIVYVAGSPLPGGMLCTNAGGLPRVTIGRNAPGWLNITNGTAAGGNLIFGNSGGADGSKLVLSGANTYWTNSGIISVGNSAGVGSHSLVISNSASMTTIGTFNIPNQASSFNSVLVDSNGRMFYRCASGSRTLNIGNSSGSSNNTVTVRGGGFWDNGAGTITIGGGGGGGINDALIVGNNGVVSNVAWVNIGAGSSLIVSGGWLSVSAAVTNNSGTIQGFGTISVGSNTFFTGTGTLTPGLGTTVGTLLFSNDVTLVSGSTTILKLDSNQTGSNDFLNVIGTLTSAGTLTVVTNGSTALNVGDSYQIFAAGGQSGSFATTNLPPIDSSKLWVTSQLGTGILGVTFKPVSPMITGPTNQALFAGGDVTISATVTGVPTPTLQWQENGTDLIGYTTDSFTITNAQIPDSGFYCLIASNAYGIATNCMTLTVATNNVPPSVSGMADQTVIQGNTATFNGSGAGLPLPTVQWQENGTNIDGATSTPLVLTNVQYAMNGNVYTLIASNSEGTASGSATLYVVILPTISVQPQSLVVTNTQSASFSVTASGVPAPGYQWYFNNGLIGGATSSTYSIPSAAPANMGTYQVVVANTAGSVSSSNATLTVNSTMTASATPSNTATGVCYDTPLYMAFDRAVVLNTSGKIKIFNVTNSVTPVETLDMSQNDANGAQARTIANDTSYFYKVFPVIITGNTAAIYPHSGVMTSNQTYYVTVDPGIFTETNGALFAGVTDTNAWRFTTKSAPVNPNNVIVAADGSGDFCTVQGALDSLPSGNTTPTLFNIHNGTYTELIDTRFKNHVTFRGQDRHQTIIKYANNSGLNNGTHIRIVFKVFSDDIAIDNLTVTNSSVSHNAQAECFMLDTNIKRFIMNNAEAHSYLDTIDSNTDGTQGYFNNCLIRGDQDVVWGNGGNLFLNNCEIRTLAANGSSTQGRNDSIGTGSNGFSFVHCRITVDNTNVTNCLLGRSLGNADGNVVYSYCNFNTNLVGWTDGAASRYWEYANSNLDGTAAAPVWAPANQPTEYLTNGDARQTCAVNPSCWLYGWTPQLSPNIIGQPTNLTVNSGQPAAFTVSATGMPDPTYQWLKAGSNLVGATNATFSIPSTVYGDGGVYSVIVSNASGTVTSSTATLTVIPNAFEAWLLSHFGCTSCPQAAPTADPDGDGQNNLAEYLAGTDPLSASSALRIISAVRQSTDVVITWTTAGGGTNAVQATAGSANGSYSTNNFADITAFPHIIIPGSGDVTTNYTDVGGATNKPSRYYRVRLAP